MHDIFCENISPKVIFITTFNRWIPVSSSHSLTLADTKLQVQSLLGSLIKALTSVLFRLPIIINYYVQCLTCLVFTFLSGDEPLREFFRQLVKAVKTLAARPKFKEPAFIWQSGREAQTLLWYTRRSLSGTVFPALGEYRFPLKSVDNLLNQIHLAP